MEEHIGDGVYASFDGYQIWLRVDRGHGSERIALEPGTYNSLRDFAKRIWGERA